MWRLQEYTGDFQDQAPLARRQWSSELVVLRRASRGELLQAVNQLRQTLAAADDVELVEHAAAAWRASSAVPGGPTLAIVASSPADLKDKLGRAVPAVEKAGPGWEDPHGMFFAEAPAENQGKLALLFPGQGSQYPNMLADLAVAFPEVRQVLDRAEAVLEGQFQRPLAPCSTRRRRSRPRKNGTTKSGSCKPTWPSPPSARLA